MQKPCFASDTDGQLPMPPESWSGCHRARKGYTGRSPVTCSSTRWRRPLRASPSSQSSIVGDVGPRVAASRSTPSA